MTEGVPHPRSSVARAGAGAALPPAPRARAMDALLALLSLAGVACTGGAAGTLRPAAGARIEGFDRVYALPFEPAGLVASGPDLLVGDRRGGVVRLSPDGDDGLVMRRHDIVEERYGQKIDLHALATPPGALAILTNGAWFQSKSPVVLALLHPDTLEVTRTIGAPPQVGALTWDGKGYWAATRRNVPDEETPAHLYRLDPSFRVVATHDTPGVGCQGLAWDGKLLWFVDVFGDRVHVLDVSGDAPAVVRSAPTPFTYASGVAWDGTHLWMAEYGQTPRLARADAAMREAWLRGDLRGGPAESDTPDTGDGPAAEGTEPAAADDAAEGRAEASGPTVEELRRKLRSDDRFERQSAAFDLSRLGEAVDYARYEPVGDPDTGAEDTDLLDLRVEMRDGRLVVSWAVWIGEGLLGPFVEQSGPVTVPTFARYRIRVRGDALSEPVEIEREAQGGRNEEADVELLPSVEPGKYRVDVFIHVQYVKPDGQPMVLNDSAGSVEVGG